MRPLDIISEGSSQEDIDRFVDSLAVEPTLAFDTEADSFYRYREKVCLMQFSTPERDFLFDPLVHGMPRRLAELIESPEHTWILHGGDFDVLSIRRDFDVGFGRLFDTGVAARFLGDPATGLASVLAARLEVTISKSEQRSDWGRRPLTDKQIGYARLDTMHLLDLFANMTAALTTVGRLHWVEQECDRLRQRIPVPKVFDPDAWLKIKGSKSLGEPGRRALRAAFLWREETADRTDKAPFRVIGNEGLVAIGMAVDKDGSEVLRDLARVKGMPRRGNVRPLAVAVRKGLETTDLVVSKRSAATSDGASADKRRGHMDAAAKARLERLRKGRIEWAAALGLEPGLLLPSALLETLARDPPSDRDGLCAIEGLTEWRAEAVGDALLLAL